VNIPPKCHSTYTLRYQMTFVTERTFSCKQVLFSLYSLCEPLTLLSTSLQSDLHISIFFSRTNRSVVLWFYGCWLPPFRIFKLFFNN